MFPNRSKSLKMSLDNWNVTNLIPLDVKNPEQIALFESWEGLNDEEFQLLSKEKRDWHRDFGVVLEVSLKQKADLVLDLAQREEARKRRVALLSQGMSVVNAVVATPKGSFGVIDEDNRLIQVDVDNNKWALKKIPSALFRRLASDAKQKEFMNAALIIDASRLVFGLKKKVESEQARSVFHQPRSFSSNDIISGAVESNFIDEAILLELQVLQVKSALEMFFGSVEWDPEVICLSLFASKGLVWGTWDTLLQSLKNFVGLANYAFGMHMAALLPPILRVITNSNAQFVVKKNMMFLIYFVNDVLRTLWGDLRLPYYEDGVLVPLGSLGWVGHLEKICSDLKFDDVSLLMFDARILPTLPAIILAKANVSVCGVNERSSGMMSSHSSAERVVRQSDSFSQDKKRKALMDGGDQNADYPHEKGYCIRHVGGECLKIPKFPKCGKSAHDCKFKHCELGDIVVSKLKHNLDKTMMVSKDLKDLLLVELSKKFPIKKM